MRLDRFIANNTLLTRKQVKLLLGEGSVCVDGRVELNPATKLSASSSVSVDGALLTAQGSQYLMMHKPVGYVCANHDSEHPVVFDLLAEIPIRPLHVVGRLDIDTTGLLLLTDDGQWSHRITSPKSGCKKVYRVRLAEDLTEKMVARLREGVFLGEEKRRTLPALVEMIDARTCLLTIEEGRYHQVKRMMAAVGNAVTELKREKIGAIMLDDELACGEYRPLTDEEVASVV